MTDVNIAATAMSNSCASETSAKTEGKVIRSDRNVASGKTRARYHTRPRGTRLSARRRAGNRRQRRGIGGEIAVDPGFLGGA